LNCLILVFEDSGFSPAEFSAIEHRDRALECLISFR
jgi:hypothetical protein